MGHVTIEGSLTPSVDLARGARRTVAVTDHIRRLVAGGFVTVVAGDLDEKDTVTATESEPAVEPPAGNASTEEWLEFLQDSGIEVPADEDGEMPGREALKAIWRQHSDAS